MQEVWKDIIGYEGYYQISNFGRVRSLDRLVSTGKESPKFQRRSGRVLCGNRSGEYCQVILGKGGKTKPYLIHRLVATAFIPNPNNYPCVNHKDENKKNNRVDNLEWCTYKYNNEYNGRVEKCREKISAALKGRKPNRVLTDEMRRSISEGAKRGWETRRRNLEKKCEVNTDG